MCEAISNTLATLKQVLVAPAKPGGTFLQSISSRGLSRNAGPLYAL